MNTKKLLIIIIFILFMPVIYLSKDKVILDKCIDGDTASFIYNKETIKVRFLAIDAPESTNKKEPFGKEASNFTCSLLKNANNIYLEFDKNSTKLDKYGRTLAWVYADDLLIQEELIKEGLAKVEYIYGNYLHTNKLLVEEKIAKDNKLNIWKDYVDNRSFIDKVFDFINSHVIYQIIALSFIVAISPYISTKFKNNILKKIKRKL